MLISAFGVAVSGSWMVMRSLMTRSMRSRPDAELLLDQLADGAHAAVAEVVDVVRLALAVVQSTMLAMIATRSSLVRMRIGLRHRPGPGAGSACSGPPCARS